MAQTRFAEKTIPKLKPGVWTDARYPNLYLRVGKKTRTWNYRPQRQPDGSRPYMKLGRYPALNLEAAVQKYKAEDGRLARGEAHPDVDKRIAELEAELRALKRTAGKLVSFGKLAERFLADYVPRTGRPLAPKTHRRYEQLLQDHALPLWEDTDVEQIEEDDVEALLDKITASGTPFSANHLLKILKTMYSWGIKKKLASKNPCANIKKLPDNERTRVLSPDELRHAWSGFDELPNGYGAALQLLTLTLQRRNEVVELPWSEIQGDWWCLPGQRTKMNKPNLIFITPLSRAILDACKARSGSSQYVFPHRGDKRRPVSGGCITHLCTSVRNRLLDRGEISSPFTVHDLRRTGATTMRSQGVDRRVVERILNHTKSSVTDIYDLYGMGPEVEQALTLWDEYLTDLLGIKPAAD